MWLLLLVEKQLALFEETRFAGILEVKNKMEDELALHGTEISAVLVYPRKYLIMAAENNAEHLNVVLRRGKLFN